MLKNPGQVDEDISSIKSRKDFEASEDFCDMIADYLSSSYYLNHVDLSGMNFSRDQLIQVATAAAQSEGLCGVHLSDNGLRKDEDLLGETLDAFGLDPKQEEKAGDLVLNLPVSNPKALQEVVARERNILTGKVDPESDAPIDPLEYQKHLIQAKQAKEIHKSKVVN